MLLVCIFIISKYSPLSLLFWYFLFYFLFLTPTIFSSFSSNTLKIHIYVSALKKYLDIVPISEHGSYVSAQILWLLRSSHLFLKTCCCLVAMLCQTLLQLLALSPIRPCCPWDFPGKKTGVGCHFLLQWTFPTRDQTCVYCIGRQIIYHWAMWEAFLRLVLCLVAQACPTLQPHGLQPARLFCPWGFSEQEYWRGLPSPPLLRLRRAQFLQHNPTPNNVMLV